MKIKIKDKVYEIKVSDIGKGKVKITVDGEDFIFGEIAEQKGEVAKTFLPKRNFSKKEIKAPIAGEVSEVFIKEGEFIRAGQKLLLLSAMKMENEIVSDLGGQVKGILVKKNQKVKEGDVLLILK